MANPGPVAAIRQFCLECQGNSSRSVRQCADEDCPLWGWRMAAIEADSRPEWHGPDAPRRALRVIRGQCMMCAGSRADVRQCAAREDCVLWRYRFGVISRSGIIVVPLRASFRPCRSFWLPLRKTPHLRGGHHDAYA